MSAKLTTGFWNNYAAVLHQAAQAWEPAGRRRGEPRNTDRQRLGRAIISLSKCNLAFPP